MGGTETTMTFNGCYTKFALFCLLYKFSNFSILTKRGMLKIPCKFHYNREVESFAYNDGP